jgi:hypothetical protein
VQAVATNNPRHFPKTATMVSGLSMSSPRALGNTMAARCSRITFSRKNGHVNAATGRSASSLLPLSLPHLRRRESGLRRIETPSPRLSRIDSALYDVELDR